jgi:hypothetical protein
MSTDTELIERLGGPAKLAERLGYDKRAGGIQRVQNWLTRGIPAKVKLDHPDVFLVKPTRRTATAGQG